ALAEAGRAGGAGEQRAAGDGGHAGEERRDVRNAVLVRILALADRLGVAAAVAAVVRIERPGLARVAAVRGIEGAEVAGRGRILRAGAGEPLHRRAVGGRAGDHPEERAAGADGRGQRDGLLVLRAVRPVHVEDAVAAQRERTGRRGRVAVLARDRRRRDWVA